MTLLRAEETVIVIALQAHVPVHVYSEPGSGKSATLAGWTYARRPHPPDDLLLGGAVLQGYTRGVQHATALKHATEAT